MNLFRTLNADEIECRVSKVYDWGVSVLLYKTARTDMELLDETFGADNWLSDYKEIKGNLFCGIGVYSESHKDWIWKWDCGIESREDNGNEKKGEASDAMKRAGFKWGIGRELYTAPRIFIKCATRDKDGKIIAHYFIIKEIEYDESRRISHITICENDEIVYEWSKGTAQKKEKMPETSTDMLKAQLIGLADGDLTRLNVFLGKLFGDGKTVDNLTREEYEIGKIRLAQARSKK